MILMTMATAAAMAAADVGTVLDGLAGHCFTADFGGGTHDRHCFSVEPENKLGTDAHVVTNGDGKAVYEGVTVYQVTASGIQVVYYNSLGDTMTWTVDRSGDTLNFHGAPDVTWHVSGDSYSFDGPSGPRVYLKEP